MTCVTFPNPFLQILSTMGQTITLTNKTRVLDSNGELSSITEANVTTSALVQEIGEKEKLYIQMGIINLGDIQFFISPDISVEIYDTITYSGDKYSVRKILMPPKIYGELIFKRLFVVKDVKV